MDEGGCGEAFARRTPKRSRGEVEGDAKTTTSCEMGFDSGIASFAPFVTRGTSLPRTQPKPRVPHGMHSVSPNKIFSRLRSRVCCSSCPHPTSPSRALRVGASSRLETMRPGDEALRVLYITLEFRAGAFSGNGVYAQSQARALGRAGHRVLVVCGTPDAPDSASAPDLVSPDPSPRPRLRGRAPGPSSSGVVSTSTSGVRSRMPRARPDPSPRSARSTRTSSSAWTGPHSRRERLRAALDPPPDRTFDPFHPPPFVYANFRVFTHGPAHESPSPTPSPPPPPSSRCAAKTPTTRATTTLPASPSRRGSSSPPSRRRPKTRARDGSTPNDAAPRRYLTCVRHFPEKEPERFVALVERSNAERASRRR